MKIVLAFHISKHKIKIMHKLVHRQKRLTCGYIAGEALFVVGGDRLAVKDAARTQPKRQFKPGSPHQVSGTVIVGAMAAPDRQPRDWAPRYPTVANIAPTAWNFHLATLSHNLSDWARHEYPRKIQAN